MSYIPNMAENNDDVDDDVGNDSINEIYPPWSFFLSNVCRLST